MATASANISGLSTTPVITAQSNVQNFGKTATGIYTATFATAFPTADFHVSAIAINAGAPVIIVCVGRTTTTASFYCTNDAGVPVDPAQLSFKIDSV